MGPASTASPPQNRPNRPATRKNGTCLHRLPQHSNRIQTAPTRKNGTCLHRLRSSQNRVQTARDEEEWDLPPPPPAALKTASKPPRDEKNGTCPTASRSTQTKPKSQHSTLPTHPRRGLRGRHLPAHCVRAESALEPLEQQRRLCRRHAHLLAGSLRVPVQTEPVRSLTLNLPGGAKLALRIKNQVDGAT